MKKYKIWFQGATDKVHMAPYIAKLEAHLKSILEPQFEDWSEQTDLRIANRELRRVHADGQATGAGGEVIPEQRPLPPLVELALRIQRQRTSRNNEPALQSPVNLRVNTRRHVK